MSPKAEKQEHFARADRTKADILSDNSLWQFDRAKSEQDGGAKWNQDPWSSLQPSDDPSMSLAKLPPNAMASWSWESLPILHGHGHWPPGPADERKQAWACPTFSLWLPADIITRHDRMTGCFSPSRQLRCPVLDGNLKSATVKL